MPDETPWDRYDRIEFLGAGGYGEVWRAHDRVLDRPVALKFLDADLAVNPRFRRVLVREAKAAARLNGKHHVITIHDFREEVGQAWLVMEFVEGRNLETLLAEDEVDGEYAEDGLDPERAVRIVLQVVEALAFAHANKLVHRDVKPSNILVEYAEDDVHLVDFGVVGGIGDASLTDVSVIGKQNGSPRYMSPERYPGRAPVGADPLREELFDVYGLACVLYECLTGLKAFPQAEGSSLESAHRRGRRPRPSEHNEDLAPFDGLVVDGLARSQHHRVPSMVEFRSRLEEALETWRTHRVPAPRAAEGEVRPAAGTRGTVDEAPPAGEPRGTVDEAPRAEDAREDGEGRREQDAPRPVPWEPALTGGAITGIAGGLVSLAVDPGLPASLGIILGGWVAGALAWGWWRPRHPGRRQQSPDGGPGVSGPER